MQSTDTAEPTTPVAEGKPLTGREQANLKALIRSDFDEAARNLQGEHDTFRRAAMDEIQRTYEPDAEVVARLDREASALESEFRAKLAIFVADAKAAGYAPRNTYRSADDNGGTISLTKVFERAGRTEAVNSVDGNARYAMDQAQRDLRSAEAQAHRQVLLATLESGAAKDLLASIPSAHTAFAAAIEARKATS